MLPAFTYDSIVICYVLPVLSMTSCFHTLVTAASPHHMQRMYPSAACATSCAMPTVDESNHSPVGKLHLHCSATFFLYVRPTLCCLIPPTKNCSIPLGIPPIVKSHPLVHMTHHPKRHISVHTFNFYCYQVCLYRISYTYCSISMQSAMNAQHATLAMLNFPTD